MNDLSQSYSPSATADPLEAAPFDSASAEETIRELRDEIAALKVHLADDALARDLRELFSLAAYTGTIVSPGAGSALLRSIVQTASYFLSAQAASLFLVDQERQQLVVATALGSKSALVEQIRVPLGHGIAGLVAVTGEPMAISDVANDPRHAADISTLLGHVPDTILCAPLLYDARVIGVLELFDKEDGSDFDATDIEALSLFTDLAAAAIEQSCKLQRLTSLVGEVLALVGEPSTHPELNECAEAFARRIEEDEAYRTAFELARLIQEISSHGDDELDACRALVRGFAQYLRARPRSMSPAQ
jgi:GAF domain-containing protein